MKLAKRTVQLTSSSTLAITSKAKAMKKEGIDVIDFGAGEPDFDTPKTIKNAAIDAINRGFTKYTPASGTVELKRAVSKKFKVDNGLDYAPEQIVITCGAKHALFNIFQVLCDMGDEVIIIAPYWVSYPEMVKFAGARPVIIKTMAEDGFRLPIKELRNKISKKTKALVVNSPSNPAGIVYNGTELREIADVAECRKIFIISDEIYEKIIFDGEKHVSIASLGKTIYERTLTVNGVSKTYSMTGWRIGYLAARPEFIKSISALQSHSTSNPTSISQAAATAALNLDKSVIEKMRKSFEERRDFIAAGLDSIKKLSYIKPKGAFYVFCGISRTGIDADTFAKKLLEEEKVCVIPGTGFGFNDHVRLSFATGTDNIKRGLERIGEFVNKYG